MAHHRYNLLSRWTHEMFKIHHFALLLFKNYLTMQVGMLHRIHQQCNRYESALDDTPISIESLSLGYLPIKFWTQRLYLGIWKQLQITRKTRHLSMNQSSLMFTNTTAFFTNTIDDLILQLLILTKLKILVPMSLYSMNTVPLPLHAETYTGTKREYTQIISETECIALTKSNYVPLKPPQISLCAKIGYMYYC